jgi:hypothetical protein
MKIETPIKLTESALVQLKKIKEDQNITEEHGQEVDVLVFLTYWVLIYQKITTKYLKSEE